MVRKLKRRLVVESQLSNNEGFIVVGISPRGNVNQQHAAALHRDSGCGLICSNLDANGNQIQYLLWICKVARDFNKRHSLGNLGTRGVSTHFYYKDWSWNIKACAPPGCNLIFYSQPIINQGRGFWNNRGNCSMKMVFNKTNKVLKLVK